MNTPVKTILATAFALASFMPIAYAQTAESVTVVYIDSLDNDANRQTFTQLKDKAAHPDLSAEAQKEAAADAAISKALTDNNVELQNVIQIDTAANGGKVVYVK